MSYVFRTPYKSGSHASKAKPEPVTNSEENTPKLEPKDEPSREHATSEQAGSQRARSADQQSRRSNRSSVALAAARKQLELEAAQAEAEIEQKAAKVQAMLLEQQVQREKELISKKLEADLAKLEEDKASLSSRSLVEDWLHKCSNHFENKEDVGPAPQQQAPAPLETPPRRRSPEPSRRPSPAPPSYLPPLRQPSSRPPMSSLSSSLSPSERKENRKDKWSFADIHSVSSSASTDGGRHRFQGRELLTRLATSKDLPIFSGDPMEWLQFKAAYYESTRLCKYSDTENVWRLRKCLRGDAKEATSSLLIGDTTPHVIMEMLELRFGRPEVIINRITAQMKKLPPLSNSYHNDIINFAIKVKNYTEAARAIKQEDYLRSPDLVSAVICKLPAALITKWADYTFEHQGDPAPKLQLLTQFLFREATKTAICGVSYIHSQSESKRKPDVKPQAQNVLVCTDSTTNNKEPCGFCKGDSHNLADCSKFKRAMRKDRWRFVRTKKLCFKCFGPRHANISECAAPACDVDDCGRDHHRMLHWKGKARSSDPPPSADERAPDADADAQETVAHAAIPLDPLVSIDSSIPRKVLLKIVPVTVRGPRGDFHTHALLDDGATVSLISSDIANKAGLHGKSVLMRARGAWESGELVCQSEIVNFSLQNSEGKQFHITARKINELNLPAQQFPFENYDKKYKHLNLCTCDAKTELLIGQDNCDLIVPISCIMGGKGEPYVTKTKLGWCIHGSVCKYANLSADRLITYCTLSSEQATPPCSDFVAHAAAVVPDYEFATPPLSAPLKPRSQLPLSLEKQVSETLLNSNSHHSEALCSDALPFSSDFDLHEMIRKSFSLESIGICNKPRKNPEELRALEILDKTSEIVNGQWTVGLPWRNYNEILPDSFPTALNRLNTILRKISANEAYGSRYRERVDHLFVNNYAREVDPGEPGARVWYLPHFGVDNPKKKKLRLVFDAAAKTQGRSLNDFLLQGPDLLCSLYGIMLRFRESPVGVIGDIKDMFLRIKIQPQDQHALRFLWVDNKGAVKHYAMTSLIFGANCSPFIAQYVNKNKNASRFRDTMPDGVDAILKNQYMDDYIDSFENEQLARRVVKEVSFIHEQGGFEMRNWASNLPSVLDVPKETLSSSAIRFNLENQPERTLGLLWYPSSDTLGFDLKSIDFTDKQSYSKRDMVRIIMSIFDIHGYLNPFTVNAKILMQQTWKFKLTWDQSLPDELLVPFKKWLKLLPVVGDIRIPRWYFMSRPEGSHSNGNVVAATMAGEASESSLELHVLCDASPSAYAAVAYFRKICGNGRIIVSFVCSKSRVAPVKPVTIPRLELQGALLACRLADSIRKEHRLQPTDTYFWTDSTTVLHWIRNDTRSYKVFIANRLGEIDELSKISQWRYIPTALNLADLATKTNDYQLHNESEWFTGPPFLYQPKHVWPKEPTKKDEISDELLEKLHTVCAADFRDINCPPVPEPTRFSSWLRLVRATANVLLFIERCKKNKVEGLNSELMHRAEVLLLRHAQAQCFSEDIVLLSQGKKFKSDSRLRSLTPLIGEDGLLRVGGRINAAQEVGADMKSPIILDGKHHIARLLVKDYHIRANHSSNELVVNELRQRYWLIRLRPTVRTVAAQCHFCRIRKTMPKPSRLGDLPEARLAHHQRPFTMCGVDLFGPINVTVGRTKPHRYGVLFTCLTIRAVHIELVSSLTADALIMALRRMAARRGWPKVLYSDNGTNMRGADSELRKAYNEHDRQYLATEALNRGVEWRFIPPASPHMGGAWERLIRSVKTALRVVLKEQAPKEEVLATLMSEVENMINSRPLTHVSVDPRSQETLTPNHFLIGTSSNLPLPGVFDEGDLYRRKQWRIAQLLADHFWNRWVKEVLPELLPRGKWQQEGNQFRVGDLVVIADPAAPRNYWPKGIIQAVYPGKDGRVRVVDIKTKTGVMKRSVTKVAKVFDECC